MKKVKVKLGEKITNLFVIILIIPLIVLILPFSLLYEILIADKRQKRKLRKFRDQANGNYFLICSKRHNWYDFIQNNVIPVLPSNLNIVWYEGNCDLEIDNIRISATEVPGVYGATKPLLLTVFPDHINVESLNNDFKELRQMSMRKDENVREKARILIEEKLRNNN